jgi:hypothetical protein
LLASSACGAHLEDSDEQLEDTEQNAEELVINSAIRIPGREESRINIRVCWKMTATVFNDLKTDRELVQAAITDSWDRESWVNFKDWDKRCTADATPNIVEIDLDLTTGIGSANSEAVSINRTVVRPGLTREQTLQMTAVHEFGHTLHFGHAHQRYDWESCPDGSDPPFATDGFALGDPEREPWSIMSYCIPQRVETFTSTGSFLSDTDISSVKAVFGASGQHVNYDDPFAIRSQNAKYFRLVSDGRNLISKIETDSGAYRVFEFKEAEGTTDNKRKVEYGDFLHMRYVIRDEYVCMVNGALTNYSGSNDTYLNSNCRWRVSSTSGTVGGEDLEVNEPVRFRHAPLGGALGSYLTLENESHWRVLGPITPLP